ncbi:hypothetical protein ACROYT_G040147 [Oculina patagonica]
MDPGSVACDMRYAKTSEGTRLFTRDQFLTAQQVQSYFSRNAAKLRHQHTEDDGVSDHEAALEQQQYWDTREQVLREVQLQHPIIYDNFDLCAMYDANRLNKLSVDMLKYICEYFDVNNEQLAVRRKKKKGKNERWSLLLSLRNAIERFLNNPPFNRGISITKGIDFQSSNKLLQSQIKLNKRENKENTQHKPAIPTADLLKLKSSAAIRRDSPWGLLRNVWLHITLFWCRRVREGQRQLTKQSFQFCKDDSGQEYASMTHDEATKNHPGGIEDSSSSEKEARMYSTSEDPLFDDGLNCLKMYLQKLNPKCEALFQYPTRSAMLDQRVWYDNKPLGSNRLVGMMEEISTLTGLSRVYTNHSVRATAITLWSNAQVPSRHIMAI